MIDNLVGITILLYVLVVCLFMMYCGFKQIYIMLKPKISKMTELKGEIRFSRKKGGIA